MTALASLFRPFNKFFEIFPLKLAFLKAANSPEAPKPVSVKMGAEIERPGNRGSIHFLKIRHYLDHVGVEYNVRNGGKTLILQGENKAHKFQVSLEHKSAYSSGTWGKRPEYALGVYKDGGYARSALIGDDGKLLLMTTNRGINGFESRFSQFTRDLTANESLPSFSLAEPNGVSKNDNVVEFSEVRDSRPTKAFAIINFPVFNIVFGSRVRKEQQQARTAKP